ncbi:hypothetical protein BDB01DRAFT_854377 [Pilobolus umbonatus]|nr:hypothetical protein BDB01DRAFT_854377 [Pilobolus umbonatus]
MPYYIIDEDTWKVLKGVDWYHISSVRTLLSVLEKIDYSNPKERQEALKKSKTITTYNKYDFQCRFIENGLFFTDSQSKFKQVQDKLGKLLNYRETMTENGVMDESDYLINEENYLNNVQILEEMMLVLGDVWNRTMFESSVAIWVDDNVSQPTRQIVDTAQLNSFFLLFRELTKKTKTKDAVIDRLNATIRENEEIIKQNQAPIKQNKDIIEQDKDIIKQKDELITHLGQEIDESLFVKYASNK